MIVLLDTSEDLKVCEAEIGCPVEQLLTPLTRFTAQYPEERFAIDNGAYKRFSAADFNSLLEREKPRRKLCRFVAVPDVVASARRTLELFDYWHDHLAAYWPLALVAQDGQEDLPIPWKLLKAVFIGGSTGWKLGPHAAAVIKAAVAMDKWVHVGRINSPGRFEYFEELGADSIDGTGLSRFTWMRHRLYKAAHSPDLFSEASL
jgi:hypothetical protein